MLSGAWYAQRFRELADDFTHLANEVRIRARDDVRALTMRQLELQDRGGGLLIDATRDRVLQGMPELHERVEWHTSPEHESQVGPAKLHRGPANLFWEVCGNHLIPMKNEAGTVRLLGPEPSGVLPTAFPNQLPAPRCVTFPAANDPERQKLRRFIDEFTLGNFARACRLLAELAESAGDGPVAPDGFRWNGEIHSGLEPIPWKLLSYCWNSRDRTGPYDGMAESVWGDREHDCYGEPVKGAANKVRRFFNAHSIPLTCKNSTKHRFVSIQEKHP